MSKVPEDSGAKSVVVARYVRGRRNPLLVRGSSDGMQGCPACRGRIPDLDTPERGEPAAQPTAENTVGDLPIRNPQS